MLSSIIPTPVSSLATQFGHEQIQIDCQPSLSQPSKQVNNSNGSGSFLIITNFKNFDGFFFFGRKTVFFKILIIKINCFTNVVTYVPKKRGTNSINLQNENKSDMYFLTLLILQSFISNTFERKAHL